MRIMSIEQPVGAMNDGLNAISIRVLNRIVVLAGPNGSGKTRLLSRIRAISEPGSYARQPTGIVTEGGCEDPVWLYLQPLDFVDPSNIVANEIQRKAEEARSPGAQHLPHTSLAYIQRVQSRAWNASHQDSRESHLSRDEAISSFNSLRELVEATLGDTLNLNLDGIPTLFGKPIARASLSAGQRSLLQWCVALHAQSVAYKDVVLLVDEPENHLHPELMIATISRLVEVNSNGQMWIATHSVPLIASLYKRHADDLGLYFMENGCISFAGERPERVLRSLMGGAENVEALREFVDLPEVFATTRFASQCLVPPDVRSAQIDSDPQVSIVQDDTINSPQKIRVLDFGCGKGRVLDALRALQGAGLEDRIDYVGWDVDDRNRKTFDNVANKAYDSGTNRWFCDRQLLAQQFGPGYFDRVIMCNVLHEIAPTAWVETFNSTSIIDQFLSPSGHVLIIEDYLMPKGEYAHQFGFIVLDTEALQKLFGAGTGFDKITVRSERDGRIKGHIVPRQLLKNVTQQSVTNALTLAQRNARDKIAELRRATSHDFKSGRAHGFWVQQYANITLAIG